MADAVAVAAPAAPRVRRDDKAMLRAAADLTRDLNVPSARIYWTDFLASAALGYGARGAGGAVVPGSADWMLIRRDGSMVIDARAILDWPVAFLGAIVVGLRKPR